MKKIKSTIDLINKRAHLFNIAEGLADTPKEEYELKKYIDNVLNRKSYKQKKERKWIIESLK